MTKKLIENFDMGVDFDGVIILLAQNLYSDPNIFLRELIQNAHDAIQTRKFSDKDLAGRIEISFDKAKRTISCIDNGIGMNANDIKQHLATIGASEKRLRKQNKNEEDLAKNLIGQFGIGLLSAFIVADKVIVRTKKIGSPNAFEWHNSGSLKCDLFSDTKEDNGSEITLHIKEEFDFLLEEKKLYDIIRKYCGFIPFPISLNSKGPINEIDVPIYRDHWESEEEKKSRYALFVENRYQHNELPLDIIPFHITGSYTARGVLFFSHRPMPDDSTGVIDIFIKRTFIKENDTSLLPQWAKFVRGVIDSPDLQPTASRDNIKINDLCFDYLKEELGKIIIERLIEISQEQPKKFEKINQWHHYHLKGMACKHDVFFSKVKDLLLFDTNSGSLSLPSYFALNHETQENQTGKAIYYFPFRNTIAIFKKLADKNNLTVINAAGTFDEEFLEKYCEHDSKAFLVNLETDSSVFTKENFGEEMKPLCDRFEHILNRSITGNIEIIVNAKTYSPENMPAFISSDKSNLRNKEIEDIIDFQTMYSGIDEIAREFVDNKSKEILHLNLNTSNPLIKELALTTDLNEPDVKSIIIGLYNLALIYSRNYISESNLNAIQDEFVSTFSKLLSYNSKVNDLKLKLEESRNSLVNSVKETEWWNLPAQKNQEVEHIVLFVVMDYKTLFNPFFDAIKMVFECDPYYFEVIRADEKTYTGNLMDNIIEHYKRSDGFIIELSRSNVNVYYELGALSPFTNKRTILKFKSDDSEELPSDLKGILYTKYKLVQAAEDIAAQIRGVLKKDGEYTNVEIRNLLAKRKKRYLSKHIFTNEKIKWRYNEKDVIQILNNYKSIEDFIDEDVNKVFSKTDIPVDEVGLLQSNLRGLIKF